MSELVPLTKQGDVAVITINNPPVNALSPGVPEGIRRPSTKLRTTRKFKAAVLIGAGKTFIAGADIKEFVKITSGKSSADQGCCRCSLKIEDCRSRSSSRFTAMRSAAASSSRMACHYRVAVADRAGGTAGSEARNHSRRGRHAAFAAARGSREGGRDVHRRQAGHGAGGARSRESSTR